jgi:hypothetical protein
VNLTDFVKQNKKSIKKPRTLKNQEKSRKWRRKNRTKEKSLKNDTLLGPLAKSCGCAGTRRALHFPRETTIALPRHRKPNDRTQKFETMFFGY